MDTDLRDLAERVVDHPLPPTTLFLRHGDWVSVSGATMLKVKWYLHEGARNLLTFFARGFNQHRLARHSLKRTVSVSVLGREYSRASSSSFQSRKSIFLPAPTYVEFYTSVAKRVLRKRSNRDGFFHSFEITPRVIRYSKCTFAIILSIVARVEFVRVDSKNSNFDSHLLKGRCI